MTTIRVGKRKRFTMVDRSTVADVRLSFRARGVLLWLLDKPDDWTTTADAIATHGTEGRDAIRSALRELESCAYLVRRKWRTGTGTWQSEWTVYERPNGTEPGRETSAGQPMRETRPQELDTETETDLAHDAELKLSADPTCVTCRGQGRSRNPNNGSIIDCFCTYRDSLPGRAS